MNGAPDRFPRWVALMSEHGALDVYLWWVPLMSAPVRCPWRMPQIGALEVFLMGALEGGSDGCPTRVLHMGGLDGCLWRVPLMGGSDDYAWSESLMGASDGGPCWVSDGCFWWVSLMGVPEGCPWWVLLMGVLDGCPWWVFLKGASDGCLWSVPLTLKNERVSLISPSRAKTLCQICFLKLYQLERSFID